ncbi:hypothetical protein A4X09_0g7242 [Tilletia walkeri]|uniref:Uncharacterized protein n=1 Tax=Tilletia walkeri TaxID=117179 RepID=A0A8X7T1I2_9BASI|nr:hypothetical protein A4X09_0g7242 [Tilletia walkeri]
MPTTIFVNTSTSSLAAELMQRVVLAALASTAATEQSFRHPGILCSTRRNLGPPSIRKLTMSKAFMLSEFDGFGDADVAEEVPHLTPKTVMSDQVASEAVEVSSRAWAAPTSADEAQQTL